MAYRTFSLFPTFNNDLLTDRFTQMDNLFSRLTGEKPLVNTPSYDLVQKDKDHYELIISVPGYEPNELDISVLNNKLTINSKLDITQKNLSNKDNNSKWLHKGITKNKFSLSFNLDHRINIQRANLNNGLLTLIFTYDIPETEKPKKISIDLQSKTDCTIPHVDK